MINIKIKILWNYNHLNIKCILIKYQKIKHFLIKKLILMMSNIPNLKLIKNISKYMFNRLIKFLVLWKLKQLKKYIPLLKVYIYIYILNYIL